MKSDLPKVATELLGKPLLVHVMENLYHAGLRRFCVIVGYKRELVQSIVPELPGAKIEFAIQEEQKGTAHAFLCARDAFHSFRGPVMVASGDMPALSADSFRLLLDAHTGSGNKMTVLSANLDDPTGYGRLVRDAGGQLIRIVEHKDASAEEHKIREVNTGTYVFESPEVFSLLTRIGSENAQNEYYLPDMIGLYVRQGEGVGSLMLENAEEAQGVNSPAELEILADILKKKEHAGAA